LAKGKVNSPAERGSNHPGKKILARKGVKKKEEV
jgi:hypothetical protein